MTGENQQKKAESRDAWTRRRVLGAGFAGALGLWAPSSLAGSIAPQERSLSFYQTHTSERLEAVYWADGAYQWEGLSRIDWVLRDFRNDKTFPMDPELLDFLFVLRRTLRTPEPFQVISGYRSPETNHMLAERGGGVARNSYHMYGKAIDIRVRGRAIGEVRRAALSLKGGGVGLYRKPRFVHLDVGKVRSW